LLYRDRYRRPVPVQARIGALEKRFAQAGTASGVNTGSEHAMAQAVHGTRRKGDEERLLRMRYPSVSEH